MKKISILAASIVAAVTLSACLFVSNGTTQTKAPAPHPSGTSPTASTAAPHGAPQAPSTPRLLCTPTLVCAK